MGVATCLWLLRHLPGLTQGSLCQGGFKPLTRLFGPSCHDGVNRHRSDVFATPLRGRGRRVAQAANARYMPGVDGLASMLAGTLSRQVGTHQSHLATPTS